MPRYAVFSCLGLGDGLIALVLSNNLQLNGGDVTTFHPFLDGLQEWFPSQKIARFPSEEKLEQILRTFDRFFIIHEKSSWMQAILQWCMQNCPEKTKVLNPIATYKNDYPYWEHGCFDGKRSFVENLYVFCECILKLRVVTRSNGITVPRGVDPKKYSKRVVIHPFSSREGKNWPVDKYILLAEQLQKKGFESSFILSEKERRDCFPAPHFSCLAEMARHVAESGYMIGNDSGIGHLASCLGLPTLTICRSLKASLFWRPAWARGEVMTPSAWIPNVKGLRLRDRHWKKWISVKAVVKVFEGLYQGKFSKFGN